MSLRSWAPTQLVPLHARICDPRGHSTTLQLFIHFVKETIEQTSSWMDEERGWEGGWCGNLGHRCPVHIQHDGGIHVHGSYRDGPYAWMNLGFGPLKFLAFFGVSNPFEEMDEEMMFCKERWQPKARKWGHGSR